VGSSLVLRMELGLVSLLLVLVGSVLVSGNQTVYQYFTGDAITQGLTAVGDEFQLNGKDMKILSGSLHYFRVHPAYWRERLRQYRAAGLNAIDVYVPWNLHEPQKGVFDFGDGTGQFSPFLDLPAFLAMAMEEDLLVIFRPGPYICGEWEFGGMPSWLLHQHPMFFRSSFAPYQERAELFLHEVISRVVDMQFFTGEGSKGGPIIMVQIENEYGNYGYGDHPRDKAHLKFLKTVLEGEGIESLLFTSDTPKLTLDWGNVDNVLMTANFKWGSLEELAKIKELRPNAPILVSEFWPGWFDHWFEQLHNDLPVEDFREILGNIFSYNGSVNFYMFHGGTNFGYMNGGNILSYNGLNAWPHYVPDVTSYDYDAPITESGHYTEKYMSTSEMIEAYDPLSSILTKPDMPVIAQPTVYKEVIFDQFMQFNDIVASIPESSRQMHDTTLSMEELDINNGNGQSYGYLVYRKEVALAQGAVLTVRGHVRDLLQVFVNGIMINEPILELPDLANFGSWADRDQELIISLPSGVVCEPTCTLDLMVENLARANFGAPHNFQGQKKGLWEGDILLDNVALLNWEHIAIEQEAWMAAGTKGGWQQYKRDEQEHFGVRLFRGNLEIEGSDEGAGSAVLQDTFFDYDCANCSDWKHGAVAVNGFNVGRYYQVGPQKTLYIPGPLLKYGKNEILIFENYLGQSSMKFTDVPNYGRPMRP